MKKIVISNFGPIAHLSLTLDEQLNIVIGAQASGKSTIGKLIYFCRKIRDYLINYLTNPENFLDIHPNEYYINFLKFIRKQFMGCFGTTKHMSPFSVEFYYDHNDRLLISLDSDGYAKLRFSDDMTAEINSLINNASNVYFKRFYSDVYGDSDFQDVIYKNIQTINLINKELSSRVAIVFHDNAEIIYIPAGRSLLASMSEQLHDVKVSEMDLTMQDFIDRIRRTKSKFGNKIPEMAKNYTKTIKGQIKNANVELAYTIIKRILKADYVSDNDGEKLYFDDNHWVKLMYGSSGQQESLWILMLAYTIILEDKKVFMVLEEPEAHLFPVAQKYIVELISLLINSTNSEVLLTTHSPYILTSMNLLIYSAYIENNKKTLSQNQIVNRTLRLSSDKVAAYLIDKDSDKFLMTSLKDSRNGLIDASKIDQISNVINENTEKLMELESKYDL